MFNRIKNIFSYFKEKRALNKMDPSKVNKFSFKGLKQYVKIIKCYDGDTVTVLFRWNGIYVKKSCRLMGIDTPELRTKSKKEKNMAIAAKTYLESLILNKVVKVEFLADDKYGRPLINIYKGAFNKKTVNDMMIDNGYARQYYGQKKLKW